MPYIKSKHQRKAIDAIVKEMGKHLLLDGDLNYLLFAFCKRYVGVSYSELKNFLGELNECGCEVRRRMLVPYELKKIKENGDIK